MTRVEADPAKNLLTISFSGKVAAADVRDNFARIKELVKTVRPGFRLLSDLTGLESMEPDSASTIKQTMDLLREAGIAKVVRVIPDPHKDIGLQIMSVFHYPRKVRIVTCETLEEAMRALE